MRNFQKSGFVAALIVITTGLSCTAFARDDKEAAALICSGKTPSRVYDTFMDHSRTLKFRLSVLYTQLSDSMEKLKEQLCKDPDVSKDGPRLAGILFPACNQTCDKTVDHFVSGNKERKELFNECAMICDVYKDSYDYFLAGYERGSDAGAKKCASVGSSAPSISESVTKTVREITPVITDKGASGAAAEAK